MSSHKDKGTGKEHKIRIESSGGLTKDEIEKMQRDAEAHAADDKKKRELAEARNTAEQRVYQVEKLMDESKDKLSEGDKSAVQAAIAKVKETLKNEDVAAINQAVEDLQRASQAMAEHLYAANGQPREPVPRVVPTEQLPVDMVPPARTETLPKT